MKHLLCVIAFTLASVPAIAGDGPKVGVALSGGGARGLAHIGVLKVLEEVGMPIDAVTGTSIGAVMGGLYAAGYSAAEIEQIALSEDWRELIVNHPSRRGMNFIRKRWDELYFLSLVLDGVKVRVPSAIRSGQEITDLLTLLTFHVHDVEDFRQLPIPFSCVALDLVSGETVVLDHGSLPAAMRASMGFQSVFAPVEIDGRLLVDGGLGRDLPAVDALNLGADLVIGIDVSIEPKGKDELDSLLDVAGQMLLLAITENTLEQVPYCRLLIRPELGDMEIGDFDDVQAIIDLGEAAARSRIDDLRALADSVTALAGPTSRPARDKPAPVTITVVEIEGLDNVPVAIVNKELGLTPPVMVGSTEIQRGISRLYNTDYFDTVRWRVEGPGDKASLRLDVTEKDEDRFRVGVRFDSDDHASILLNATLRNVGRRTSILQFDAGLGERSGIVANYITHTGLFSSLGLALGGGVEQTTFELRDQGLVAAQYDATYWSSRLFFGTLYSDWLNIGVGGRAEYVDMRIAAGQAREDSTETVVPLFGVIAIDTSDETIYPESGIVLEVEASAASKGAGSDMSFGRAFLDLRLVLPIGDRVSILHDLYLGASVEELPVAYHFFLGGVNRPWTHRGRPGRFFGVRPDVLIGPHAQQVALGLQWRIHRGLFAQALWNAGNTFDEWSMNLSQNQYVNGGGIVLGGRFFNARVEVSFGASELEDLVTHFTVGNHF